jgi:hypothetical protein
LIDQQVGDAAARVAATQDENGIQLLAVRFVGAGVGARHAVFIEFSDADS